MKNAQFNFKNAEYKIVLNDNGFPSICRLDGEKVHKPMSIVKAKLEELTGEVIDKEDTRDLAQLTRDLSKELGYDIEKDEKERSLKALNDFISDSSCLNELYRYTGDINIFDVLGEATHEIRHSNMIAWLLDPNANHGFGDYFIKQFLFEAVSTDDLDIMRSLRPIDIDMMDFDDLVVMREKEHIDILAVSESNKLVFAIENKIDSKEHSNQLERYLNYLRNNYPKSYHFVLVYLTPDGSESSDNENWLAMDYDFVKRCIENALDNYEINRKVRNYLEDYVMVLRRNVVEDKEIREICTKIYKKHSAALELIFKNKPDIRNTVSDYIEKYLEDHAQEFDIFVWQKDQSPSFCRFIPNSLKELFANKAEGWCSYGYFVGFEFYMPAKGAVTLSIVIGPTKDKDSQARQDVLDAAVKHPDLFKMKKTSLSARWKHIDNFQICSQIQNLIDDDNEIKDLDKELGDKLNRYFTKELQPKIDAFIKELK